MALNPEINPNTGEPILFDDNELFLIRRDRINFTVKETSKPSKIGKFSAKGTLYLTTESLFFVAAKPKVQSRCWFVSFRIPLTKMTKEKFNQPIFGANNLTGRVPPAADQNFLQQFDLKEYKFCFTFNEGGCGTFLPIFFRIMGAIKQFGEEAAAKLVPQVMSGMFSAAYVDPSDPSKIYVSQPLHGTPSSSRAPPPQVETRGARPVNSRMCSTGTRPATGVDAGSYLMSG
jgi:hypothetical protein